MRKHDLNDNATNGGDGAPGLATLDDVVAELRAVRIALVDRRAELLDADTAAAMVGVSRATWDRMRSAALVPAPVKLNNGTITRWRRAELVQWIEDGCPNCS